MSKIAISPEVAKVLREATAEGKTIKLNGQLDRATYTATNKILDALGGKWDRKAGAHVFPFEIAPKLAEALGDGSTDKPVVENRKKKLQFFETPEALAEWMVKLANVDSRSTCLEPSAGGGRIAKAMRSAGAGTIVAVEIDPDNCDILTNAGFQNIYEMDFLTFASSARFDAIVMNPPFANNADVKHVIHAYTMLEAGGALVAVMSEHPFFAEDTASVNFRHWLESANGTSEKLPAGTFKESGTNVNTRLVVIRKPL